MHIFLYVQDASNEEETIRIDDRNYEEVLNQIAEAKKNSTLFEYSHHRTNKRGAVNPDRIIKIMERV